MPRGTQTHELHTYLLGDPRAKSTEGARLFQFICVRHPQGQQGIWEGGGGGGNNGGRGREKGSGGGLDSRRLKGIMSLSDVRGL
jgi:hypothetical protein